MAFWADDLGDDHVGDAVAGGRQLAHILLALGDAGPASSLGADGELGAEGVRPGLFRTGLVAGVELALRSLVLAVALRRRTACTRSVCPVQAAPDQGSALVKLGPAGDC
jgi:hypothetical protein